MGYYTDSNVYGVRCFMHALDEHGNLIVFIDKKYDSKMNSAQIEEVRAEYEQISEENKNIMIVCFYATVNSSRAMDNTTSITSCQGTRKMLEKFLSGTDIRIYSCDGVTSTTTMFHFMTEIHYPEWQHYIYSVDEERVVDPTDITSAPLPLPSHLYIHIEQCGRNTSYLYLTDNMRNYIDIPEDDSFWVINSVENDDGIIHTRLLIDPEKISSVDRAPPYNLRTSFRLISGKNYRVVYKCKNILNIRDQKTWKITS